MCLSMGLSTCLRVYLRIRLCRVLSLHGTRPPVFAAAWPATEEEEEEEGEEEEEKEEEEEEFIRITECVLLL